MRLVKTKQQADRATVKRAWKGDSKSEFEAVLTALQQADIPLRFQEHVKIRPTFQLVIFGVNLFRRRSTFESEFEVKVLSRDANRARQAIRAVVGETK